MLNFNLFDPKSIPGPNHKSLEGRNVQF
jgi:hypothetical protein